MRKLFKERKLFKGGNYMRKYGILLYSEAALFSQTHELNLNLIWLARFIFFGYTHPKIYILLTKLHAAPQLWAY